MVTGDEQSKNDSRKPEAPDQTPADASPELPLKHPLEHRWSLWFYKNDRNRSWEENLLEISSFDTVEDFWSLYNYIELASKIPQGCDYSIFKYGIKPMWEDGRNRQGGRWLFNLSKTQTPVDLDNYWLEILLCLIGEGFDEFGADVCGAVVQIRTKIDKIAVWTADYRRADGNIKIGRTLKQRLNMHPRNVVQYQAHADTQAKIGSSTRARYVV